MTGFADLWPRIGEADPLGGDSGPNPRTAGALRYALESVYRERAFLLALLTRMYGHYMADIGGPRPCAWLGRHEGLPWDDEWRWVVYLDLDEGQVSWHIHRDELPLFDHLLRYEPHPDADNAGILSDPSGESIIVDRRFACDGHSTDEKYRRLYEYVTGRKQ